MKYLMALNSRYLLHNTLFLCSPVSIGVQETCYSFERPRSKTVFGSCSWNLLSMANYTNLFNEGYYINKHTINIIM